MHPTIVINLVALTPSLLEHAPVISALAARGRLRRLVPVLPAVTCSVQASMLTGVPPAEHGIVGNGWYDRDAAEVHFWKQSNRLVEAQKVWETARGRDSSFTCANMFWWYNMYSSVDYSVTPRPMYCADGRKIPDVYSDPPDLRGLLQQKLGRFPLFNFWGPATSIAASRWIADATRVVYDRHRPTLTLVYLPHLDYDLQKLGPDHPGIATAVAEIDTLVGAMLEWCDAAGLRVIVLSEYGIVPVDGAIEINRELRRAGAIRVRGEQGREMLDPGASHAFAVADHQVAHVYVRDASQLDAYAEVCVSAPGVAEVLDRGGQRAAGLDHARSGDLVLVADPGRWFAYRYWLDDEHAPDFARTVDIHRKPGYDPLELFLDPTRRFAKGRIAWKLALKKLGFRTLLDVIPLDPSLVRGSHGRVNTQPEFQPVLITEAGADGPDVLPCTGVRDVILESVFGV